MTILRNSRRPFLLATIITINLFLSCSLILAWRSKQGFVAPNTGRFSQRRATEDGCKIIDRNRLWDLRGGEVQQVQTLQQVEDILAQTEGQLVVIYFTSNGCIPCQKVAPLYQELSESDEFQNGVIFVKVNVDESPDTATHYNVTGWPTFLFHKNGEVQTEIVGGKLAEETLYDWVKLFMPRA